MQLGSCVPRQRFIFWNHESETTEKRLSEQLHLESSVSSVLSVWCLPLEATKDYIDNLYCLGSRSDYLDYPF